MHSQGDAPRKRALLSQIQFNTKYVKLQAANGKLCIQYIILSPKYNSKAAKAAGKKNRPQQMQSVFSVSPVLSSAGKFLFNPASNFAPVLVNRKRPDIPHKADKLFAFTLE